MKKLLLVAAATAAISTSAFANSPEGTIYGRIDVSANKFTGFTDKATSQKLKTKWNAGIDVGAGYYLLENVRGEVVYLHPFNVEPKKNDNATGANRTTKHKPEIHALFLKVNADVADMGVAQLFVTGGGGWSRIKEKVTIVAAPQKTTNASSKNANSFGWTVGVGAAFELTEGVKADLQYAYTDFGKSKSANAAGDKVNEYGKNKYRTHSVVLGVRFENLF